MRSFLPSAPTRQKGGNAPVSGMNTRAAFMPQGSSGVAKNPFQRSSTMAGGPANPMLASGRMLGPPARPGGSPMTMDGGPTRPNPAGFPGVPNPTTAIRGGPASRPQSPNVLNQTGLGFDHYQPQSLPQMGVQGAPQLGNPAGVPGVPDQSMAQGFGNPYQGYFDQVMGWGGLDNNFMQQLMGMNQQQQQGNQGATGLPMQAPSLPQSTPTMAPPQFNYVNQTPPQFGFNRGMPQLPPQFGQGQNPAPSSQHGQVQAPSSMNASGQISVDPFLSPQQIQSMVNNATGQNAATAGGQINDAQQAMAGRGFSGGAGANAAAGRIGLNQMMADTAAQRDIPIQAARENADYQLQAQNALTAARGQDTNAYNAFQSAMQGQRGLDIGAYSAEQNAVNQRGGLNLGAYNAFNNAMNNQGQLDLGTYNAFNNANQSQGNLNLGAYNAFNNASQANRGLDLQGYNAQQQALANLGQIGIGQENAMTSRMNANTNQLQTLLSSLMGMF